MKDREVELLTAEEEAELGRRIRGWRDHGVDPAGGLAARNELVARNLGLVPYMLSRMPLTRRHRSRFDNYIPAGEDGLMKAADNFNPSLGRFSTYATRWIQQHVQMWHCRDRIIAIPHRVFAASHRQDCEFRAQVERAKRVIVGGEDGGILEMVGEADRDRRAASELVSLLFERASLTDKEIDILRRRFGLGGEPETLEEIARGMGCVREWVRQIEHRALTKIYAASRTRPDLRAAVRDYHEAG